MKHAAVQEVVPVYAGALQHLPFAAALIDEQGCIQHATRKWEAYFQQYPGEWAGQPVTVSLPADPAVLLPALQQAAAGGPPCEGVCGARLRDGSEVQISWKAVVWTEMPLDGSDKRFLIWIDESRTVSTPLPAAQELLHTVPQLGVISLDRAGRMLDINPFLQELLGYTPGELAGLPLTVLWAPGQMQAQGPDLAAVAQGRIIEMRAVRTDHTRRVLSAKDGRQIQMHVYGRLLPPDAPSGAYAVEVLMPVPATAAHEGDRLYSLDLYQAILRNFPNGAVVVFDPDLRYFVAEGQGLAATGLNRERMLGRTIYEIYEPDIAAQLAKVYGRALNGEQHVRELTWGDRVFRLVAMPVQEESGAVQTGMVYTLDVTELKQGQLQLQRANMELEHRIQQRTSELLRANEEIKNFAYIVSHDLRIPLVNIKGFTRELEISLRELSQHLEHVIPALPPGQRAGLETLIHDELPESLQFISSGAAQMDRLIGAVLRLSRMGYREMDFKPIALKPFVEDVLRAIQHHLIEHGAQVEVGDLPKVHADPTALEQIFSNLISNAVQYRHPDRPPRIRITGEQHEQAVVIHIQDNGRGIAARNIPRIFHIFTRVGAATTEGEGMGLTFVKTLVQRHGGQIACQSELGAGSTFTFSLVRHPGIPAE